MIEVKGISKNYKDVKALEGINLKVSQGERFGLIGPDGAGKTSLFRVLTTLHLPDSGEAVVAEYDVKKQYADVRRNVGYVPGRFSLYEDLSIEENLNFFAVIFGTSVKENYHLIKAIYQQIEPFKNRKAGALSGGMKQKLALCCALIHKPKVLFLDEPTTGVDPVSRKEFWEILQGLKKYGITIFASTPYMDEANLCERIALIQGGKIMAVDKPQNIMNNYSKPLYTVSSSAKTYRLLKELRAYQHTHSAYAFGEVIHYTDLKEVDIETRLINYLHGKGHQDVQVIPTKANIEDRFIELMDQNN